MLEMKIYRAYNTVDISIFVIIIVLFAYICESDVALNTNAHFPELEHDAWLHSYGEIVELFFAV